jgi:hypothetical protein
VSHTARLNRANLHRKRILDVINRLNDTDLEKVDEMLQSGEEIQEGDDLPRLPTDEENPDEEIASNGEEN